MNDITNMINKDINDLKNRHYEAYEKLKQNKSYKEVDIISKAIDIKKMHLKKYAEISKKIQYDCKGVKKEYKQYLEEQRGFLQKYLPYGFAQRNIIDIEMYELQNHYEIMNQVLREENDYIVYNNIKNELKLIEDLYYTLFCSS